ncbi:unnamed protein product [Danaus chrysippus]|uniref:(African queen) hypothetical protein n=1 Tax=Danaus chrysippus TaxID=151541 RepID=A0A8J2VRS0_9NEOP|nr:unnamed protein product [Danaus chrysippus]
MQGEELQQCLGLATQVGAPTSPDWQGAGNPVCVQPPAGDCPPSGGPLTPPQVGGGSVVAEAHGHLWPSQGRVKMDAVCATFRPFSFYGALALRDRPRAAAPPPPSVTLRPRRRRQLQSTPPHSPAWR